MQYIIQVDNLKTSVEQVSNEVLNVGGIIHTKCEDYVVANLEFSQRQALIAFDGVVSIEADEYQFFE
jgi:hypothetical protein